MEEQPAGKSNLSSSSKTPRKFDDICKRFNSDNHSMRKRPISKPYQRENDIYVTNKTNFNAQLSQCEKILNSDIGEIYLHCVGNAITRGINLALKIQANSGGVYELEVNTSTVELIDDFHPLRDDEDFSLQSRLNSAMHIRLYRRSKFLQSAGKSN